MYRNVAAKISLFAFDVTTGLPKTGDAANLTAYVSKDGGAVTVLADTSATEMEATNAKGWYQFDLAQGETDAVDLLFTCKSGTANVSVVGRPVTTDPNRFSALVIDAAGLADANAVKIGPTGAGTAQTARDLGASVLLSSGTGTGQVDFTSGVVKANAVQLLGTAWLTPGTAGTPDVNVKLWNALATVELPLVPTTAGRKLDVSVGGEAGVDWANVGSPTTSLALTGTTIATTQKVDIETIKTNPVVNAGTITFPTTATLASTTNITAGTITTATNLTNAPTAGDFTATMKTSLNAATPVVTVSDKTGFSLSAAGIQAIWDALTSALTTVGSIGKLLVDRMAVVLKLDTTMESTGSPTDYVFTARALAQAPSGTGASAIAIADEVQTRTIAGVTLVTTTTNLTNAPTNGDLTAAMKTSVTTAATAATPIAASVTGAVGSVTGNVGGNVAGSVGSLTGLTASDVGAIKAVTDRVNTTLESTGSPTDYVFTTRALAQAPSGGSAPSAAVIADAVWDEAIAGHLAAGSTGLALNDATAAGNPWNATLEGSLTASDLLRVTAAVAVGKDTITAPGNGTAVVVFRDASDLSDIVTANLTGSRRTAVTLTP